MRRSANTASSKVFGRGGLWPLGGFKGFGTLLKVDSHTLSESLCCILRCSPPWIGYRLIPAGLSRSTAQPLIFQPYFAAMASFLACCGNESLIFGALSMLRALQSLAFPLAKLIGEHIHASAIEDKHRRAQVLFCRQRLGLVVASYFDQFRLTFHQTSPTDIWRRVPPRAVWALQLRTGAWCAR